ncbi:MAG: transcriptional regulator, partial [Kamptonema sp. SIO4C4]|nr:transcriptional regulator [Kamptonema sp. SIO4C4]
WTVRGGKEVTVSLQPSPGTVPPQGTISYPLSQEAGTEMITLTATSSDGEEVSRSVTIDKLTPEQAQVPPSGEEAVPAVPQPQQQQQQQQQDQAEPPAQPPAEEAPPLPVPPSSAPPVPPGRNAPPPSDLPPVLY